MEIEDDGTPLADSLVAFERRAIAERPELVVLVDDSETALAAALTALKLGIAVESLPEAREGGSDNARLIAQLAPAYNLPA